VRDPQQDQGERIGDAIGILRYCEKLRSANPAGSARLAGQ
jgi:hypothetical protein